MTESEIITFKIHSKFYQKFWNIIINEFINLSIIYTFLSDNWWKREKGKEKKRKRMKVLCLATNGSVRLSK